MDTRMTWRKSSFSSPNGENCVEAARVPGSQKIATRDSKHPKGPHQEYGRPEWRRFLDQIRRGTYDL
jgi:hypothetical protein